MPHVRRWQVLKLVPSSERALSDPKTRQKRGLVRHVVLALGRCKERPGFRGEAGPLPRENEHWHPETPSQVWPQKTYLWMSHALVTSSFLLLVAMPGAPSSF